MSTKPMGENEAWYRNLTRQNAVADSAKPETAEREELMRYLNQMADALCDERPRHAAALLAADGKAGGEVAGYVLVNKESREGVMFYSKDMKPDMATIKDKFELVTVYARPQPAAQVAQPLTPDQDSREMFVARLENMQKNGDKWLTIEAVLALLNDCDMLANQGIGKDKS